MKRFLIAFAAAVAGAPLGAFIGVVIYMVLFPSSGNCGQIGCWDFVMGGLVGAPLGLIAAPVVALWLLRRRAHARSAAAGE